jgi:hypothetical protein
MLSFELVNCSETFPPTFTLLVLLKFIQFREIPWDSRALAPASDINLGDTARSTYPYSKMIWNVLKNCLPFVHHILMPILSFQVLLSVRELIGA